MFSCTQLDIIIGKLGQDHITSTIYYIKTLKLIHEIKKTNRRVDSPKMQLVLSHSSKLDRFTVLIRNRSDR